MKKIALISASVLALGAAAIAADVDRLASLHASADLASVSPASAGLTGQRERGAHIATTAHTHKVRLVSPDAVRAKSCGTANWPYYPADCLEAVETAQL